MFRDKSKIIENAKCNIIDAISEIELMINANDGVGVSHWSAFILCSCVIDYLASYRYSSNSESNRERYKRFITEYLNEVSPEHQYDEDDIYHYLRCGLVHGYTDMFKGQTKFLFTHLYPGYHLKSMSFKASTGDEGTRVVIRLQDFLRDIEKASNLLFEDAFNAHIDSDIMVSMEKRVKEVGVKRSDFEIK